MFSQAALCSSAVSGPAPANTCGWRRVSLSQIAPATASKSKAPLLARHLRMEHDLEQQIAELVLEVREVAALDRIGDLVRLLEGVGRDAREGLLAIPGAAVRRAQPPMIASSSAMRELTRASRGGAGARAALRACSRRRKVISMPAVAPQMMRSPYGMSYRPRWSVSPRLHLARLVVGGCRG